MPESSTQIQKLGSLEKMNHFLKNRISIISIFCAPWISWLKTMMITSHIFHASNKVVKRNTAVCYYDCTNYYCEAESADEDHTDPITGEVLTGLNNMALQKRSQAKSSGRNGTVHGYERDSDFDVYHTGNANEQTTVLPLEKELIRMFGDKKNKFIYCADAGLGSYHIRSYNAMGGRAFIVTQSIKKLSDKFKEAVFNDFEYKLLSDETPVSIEAMKQFDKKRIQRILACTGHSLQSDRCGHAHGCWSFRRKVFANGKKKCKIKAVLKQHVIITFSRKSFEYQRFIRIVKLKEPRRS